MVSRLIFKSSGHSEFIFTCGERESSKFTALRAWGLFSKSPDTFLGAPSS